MSNDDNSKMTPADNRPSRGRGGKHNFPSAPPPQDPELVRSILSNNIHWLKRGLKEKCHTDDEFEQRTIEFFEYCMNNGDRPTVEKYCLALGYARTTIFEWENGNNNASKRRMDIIKNAKNTIAAYDADLVMSNKVIPATYIFRAKNYYGMKDQQDFVIQPKQSLSDDVEPDVIAEKYAALPDD